MIEVRVFAALRQGRDNITMMAPEGITCAGDIMNRLDILFEEVSSLLIKGFHRKPETSVKDGHIDALFSSVGGG